MADARYPAVGAHEDAVPYASGFGIGSDEFVGYHTDDMHPWANGQGTPHVSDTPYKPSYHDLPQCNGIASTTKSRCKAKAEPGLEFCEYHKG